MHSRLVIRLIVTLVLGSGLTTSAVAEKPKGKVNFKKTQLDAKFRSEGVAVADFNKDGKLDIAAGLVWYEAPAWKPHSIADKAPSTNGAAIVKGTPLHFDPKRYSHSFCTFADDLNGDSWTDLIVVDFPGTPSWWFENPKGTAGQWKKHLLTPVTNNESPTYLDFDDDGRRELIAAFSPDTKKPDGPKRQMALFTPQKNPTEPWAIQAISALAAPGTRRYSHGLGLGDINGDGRNDILCADGWWETPKNRKQAGPWKFHIATFGKKDKMKDAVAAQLHVFDFDGDGDADVLSSNPHAFGIWWHEQLPEGKWKQHEIDSSFSQTHAICVADINGDGLPDFLTGKRWWAHGGRDPGGDQPAVLCWYELSRENGKPNWTRHQFDHDSGVGTQFEVADVNGDGMLDVVTSSKKGVYYFQQSRE